jgi:hypothetical protein
LASDPVREAGIRALGRIRERLDAGPLELPSFSEEELAVITPAERGARLVPLPALDGLDADEYEAALDRGAQRLAERGYFVDGEPAGEAALVALGHLLPSTVTIADLFDGAGASQGSIYLFGLRDAGVLEERPAGDGEHAFALRSIAEAADLVASFLDPAGRAGDDGEPQNLTDAEELAARLSSPDFVGRVFTTRGTDEGPVDEDFSVATLSDGLWLVGGASDGETTLAATRAVSRETLRELLVDLLGAT